MSATIAALLVGTAAVGGFGAWAGSSSSTEVPTPKEALQQVAKVVDQEEEDEPSQPKPSTPPPTPIPEAVPEVVPTEETKEEEKVAEPLPEPVPEPAPEAVVQGGGSLKKQDGGFGKPTWAPLNSGDSLQSAIGLTKDQIGATGSSLLSKWTGAKTAESIQLKLKEIDDQLRVLKVQKFNTESDIASKSVDLEQIRTDYLKALTNKTKYEKFSIYYDRELSKLLDPKPAGSDGSLKSIVENKFPKKKDGNFIYSKAGKPNELNFEEWSKAAHEYFKTQPDEPEGIKPKDGENKDAWWTRIGKETSSVNKEPKDIESSLETLLSKKTTNTTLLEKAIQDEQEKKPNYDDSIQKLKDLRLKLQETNKKIKELLDTRELVLVELSNYELPKGLFESVTKQKPIQKPSTLPTGQERDRIFAQIKDLEKQLKNIQEQINDEIDLQLNKDSNWKPKDDKSDKYAELVKKQIELKNQRDNKILELEGRISKEVKEIPKSEINIPKERKEYLEKICPKMIRDFNKKLEALKLRLKEKESTYSEISKLEERIPKLEKINKDNLRRSNPTSEVRKKMEEHKKEEQDKKARLEFLRGIQTEDLPKIISDLKKQISDLETKIKNLESNCLKYAEIYLKEMQEAANAPQFFGPPAPAEAAPAEAAPAEESQQPPLQTEKNTCRDTLKTIMNLLPEKEQGKQFKDLDEVYKNILIKQLKDNYNFTDEEIQKCIETEIDIPTPPPAEAPAPPEQPDSDNPFAQGSSRKNHLTRKQHWTRSKPSRFKTHRIY